MSSVQAHTSPTTPAPPTPTRSFTSHSSNSEKSDGPGRNPAGTDDVAAASELLLSGAKDVREIIRLIQCVVLDIVATAINQDRETPRASDIATHVTVQDHWEVAGVSTLSEKGSVSQVIMGGRIVSTYTLAETGKLGYGCEASYAAVGTTEEEVTQNDVTSFNSLKEAVRMEMDCQICYALLLDPLTTTCGHTFCRNCLHRTLGSSEHCPICRRALSIQPQVLAGSSPSNERLTKMINGFWADTVAIRSLAVRAELQAELAGDFDVPLFVCTLSFPAMPTFLHVFEPRYRRMIRRAMEGDRTFGMVLGTSTAQSDGRNFCEIGTLLRIINIEFFPDGRSLLESVGVSRFKVTRHGALDGYIVGKIEKIDDISLAEEEELEVTETMRGRGVQDFVSSIARAPSAPPAVGTLQQQEEASSETSILTTQDLETKATRELLDIGITFCSRMRSQSVSWLTARVLAVFGDCPNDPALFPWWFASVLPVSDEEKYRLLGTSSVRQRLKICCQWIIEWESSRW